MAGRRELERRLRALGDIGAILGVMKNLALMESGKLSRVLAPQREMVATLEATAADFLAFHPEPEPSPDETVEVLLLVGSQRGFCGNFNDLILAALPVEKEGQSRPLRIAVGAKLSGRLRADVYLDGPHSAEEIGQVIRDTTDALRALLIHADGAHSLQFSALHHDPDRGCVVVRQLTPLTRQTERTEITATYPPHLNISPEAFLAQLAEQHLLAAITEVFHRSLMAESRFRLSHIEGASRRMERRITELKRKQTLARQEEIIEEIEAILAGAALDDTEVLGVMSVSVQPEKACTAG
ncbi:MAG: F0F1 ATP synthase subunit gamma [Desulfuromonadaceae bacterium]|nr:F0F1 ATP synthase subunit gamma [Desulfuromonadaceae bacterium]